MKYNNLEKLVGVKSMHGVIFENNFNVVVKYKLRFVDL